MTAILEFAAHPYFHIAAFIWPECLYSLEHGLVLLCFLMENNCGETTKNAAGAYSPDVLSLMLKIYGEKTREQKNKIEGTWKHKRPTEADHSKASCSRLRISAATVRSSPCIRAKVIFSHGHRFTFLQQPGWACASAQTASLHIPLSATSPPVWPTMVYTSFLMPLPLCFSLLLQQVNKSASHASVKFDHTVSAKITGSNVLGCRKVGTVAEHGMAAAFAYKITVLLVSTLECSRGGGSTMQKWQRLWKFAQHQLCTENTATCAYGTKIRSRQKQKMVCVSMRSTENNSSLTPHHPERCKGFARWQLCLSPHQDQLSWETGRYRMWRSSEEWLKRQSFCSLSLASFPSGCQSAFASSEPFPLPLFGNGRYAPVPLQSPFAPSPRPRYPAHIHPGTRETGVLTLYQLWLFCKDKIKEKH